MLKDLVNNAPQSDVTMRTGTCRFCGQTQTLPSLISWDSETIDEFATEGCSCTEAVEYTARKYQRENAYDKIRTLVENEQDKQREIMELAVDLITDGRLKSLTMATDTLQLIVKATAKGKIKVRKISRKVTTEEV